MPSTNTKHEQKVSALNTDTKYYRSQENPYGICLLWTDVNSLLDVMPTKSMFKTPYKALMIGIQTDH